MDLGEFLLKPAGLLRRVFAASGRIAAYETMKSCAQHVHEDKPESLFSSSSEQRADILSAMLNDLLWHGLPLRKAVLRNDWLFLQEKAVYILNHMAWMGMFQEQKFDSVLGHWEQCLHNLCAKMECDVQAGSVVAPVSMDVLADNLIALFVNALDWIKKEYQYKEDWKGAELRKGLKNKKPDVPIPLDENWAALRKLEDELKATPEHIGTLVTGSFAVENQRDVHSDLDVFAIFEQVPDGALRDDLRERLQVSNSDPSRTGGFEYLKLGMADIHFMVFERQHIANTFNRFERDGTQVLTIDFASDETAWCYSPPAHRWLSGMILSDTNDILSSFRERAQYYPPQLRERHVEKWTQVWNRYARRFQDALRENDQVTGLTALHNCVEAALRVLLANASIHAEETDVKWLCKEIEVLTPEQLPNIAEVLEVLPSDLSEPLDERFKKTQALWKIANKLDVQ